MINNQYNQNKQKKMEISDGEEYKEKIKNSYTKWSENGFSDEWITAFENKWYSESRTWDFIELLKAKKDLSEIEYEKKERKMIKKYEEREKAYKNLLLTMQAEEEAFEKAGIEEGRVEYECPICGGTAVANRYMYGGSYHGLGSGCETCGSYHT
jgi:hypothetical protein